MNKHECPSCGHVHREKPTPLKARVEMLEARVAALELGPQTTYTSSFYPATTTTIVPHS